MSHFYEPLRSNTRLAHCNERLSDKYIQSYFKKKECPYKDIGNTCLALESHDMTITAKSCKFM